MHLVLGIRAQRKQHHVVVVAAGGGACQAGGQQQRAFRRGGPVWEPRPPIASPVPHATAQAGQPAGTPGPQAHQLRQQQPLAGLACCWAGEACSNYRGKGPRTRQELRPTWHVVNALPHSVRRGEVKGSAAHRRDLAAGDGDIVHLRCEGKARGQRHPGKGGGRLSPVAVQITDYRSTQRTAGARPRRGRQLCCRHTTASRWPSGHAQRMHALPCSLEHSHLSCSGAPNLCVMVAAVQRELVVQHRPAGVAAQVEVRVLRGGSASGGREAVRIVCASQCEVRVLRGAAQQGAAHGAAG